MQGILRKPVLHNNPMVSAEWRCWVQTTRIRLIVKMETEDAAEVKPRVLHAWSRSAFQGIFLCWPLTLSGELRPAAMCSPNICTKWWWALPFPQPHSEMGILGLHGWLRGRPANTLLQQGCPHVCDSLWCALNSPAFVLRKWDTEGGWGWGGGGEACRRGGWKTKTFLEKMLPGHKFPFDDLGPSCPVSCRPQAQGARGVSIPKDLAQTPLWCCRE